MVLAHHVVLSAYGFWLPNDQRGSGSDFVRRDALRPFGNATLVTTRHSLANQPFDRQFRNAAKRTLLYPAVTFSGIQAAAVGRGFADAISRCNFAVLACAILPNTRTW